MVFYGPRIVDARIEKLFGELPAISLEGARGVGKTTTARQRAATFLALDDAPVLEVLQADPRLVATYPPPVVIDEWQRLPAVFDAVRRAVDEDRSAGRFLICGSASPKRPPTHTGAGRIVTLRMRPLSLCERWDAPVFSEPTVSLSDLLTGTRPPIGGRTEARLADYAAEITASGFPGLRGLSAQACSEALHGYIDRIIDRDFPEAGHDLRNPSALRRWLTAYAAATATTASYERIRDAATGGHGDKPSRSATAPYIDTLERLHILEPLPGWSPTHNPLAKLTSGPKHHLVDPALAVALLGIDTAALLRGEQPTRPAGAGRALLGGLFESLVALNLRTYAQAARASVHHMRKRAGEREIDFIVSSRDGRALALEAKLSGRCQTATSGTSIGCGANWATTCSTPRSSPPARRPTDAATASPSSPPPCWAPDPSAASLAAQALYPDVAATHTHRDDIHALAAQGIFDGTYCGDNLFCPDDPWTARQWRSG